MTRWGLNDGFVLPGFVTSVDVLALPPQNIEAAKALIARTTAAKVGAQIPVLGALFDYCHCLAEHVTQPNS